MTTVRAAFLWAALDELAPGLQADIAEHCVRVAFYVGVLAEQAIKMGVGPPGWDSGMLRTTAVYHDIGKLRVPREVLYKPATLSMEELEIIRAHTLHAEDMIEEYIARRKLDKEANAFYRRAAAIAKTHHEWWDGTGYPQGLRGEEIPLEGRLCGIADMYDAMTSVRPYRSRMKHEHVCNEIMRGSGTHFDPELIRVFRACMDKLPEMRRHAALPENSSRQVM